MKKQEGTMIKKFLYLAMVVVLMLAATGCQVFIEEDGEKTEVETLTYLTNESQLSNAYYVWHDDTTNNPLDDLGNNNTGHAEFKKLYKAYGLVESETYYKNKKGGDPKRLFWITDKELVESIPTMYKGDALVLSADNYRPDVIEFERFFDKGYTLGICGLKEDSTGRFWFSTKIDNSEKKNYINPLADIQRIVREYPETELTLDKINGQEIRYNNISEAGYILGLAGGVTYDLELYTGTKSTTASYTADSRVFLSGECFRSNQMTLVGSNTAIITFPEYLVSGYYYIDGAGLVRYINAEYGTDINSVDYNEPMVTYDDEGNILYDLSAGYDYMYDIDDEEKEDNESGTSPEDTDQAETY